jgi:hypothetical protein
MQHTSLLFLHHRQPATHTSLQSRKQASSGQRRCILVCKRKTSCRCQSRACWF